MAYIDVLDTSTTWVQVRLAGLDSSYNGTRRRVRWEVWYNDVYLEDYINTSIDNRISVSPIYTLRNLQPGFRYDVVCKISNISGSSDVYLETTVWADEQPGYPPDRPLWIELDDNATKHDMLVFRWQEVDDADGYYIYVDGRSLNLQ